MNFCTGCLLIFQLCMFLLNVGFLSGFEEIIGTISGKVLHGMNVFFVNASIFLKAIEKFLFKKIQKHEKQKAFIEMQLNSIRNMVLKALSDYEISASEFENILSQTRKQNEIYIKLEEMDLEIDKMLPKKPEIANCKAAKNPVYHKRTDNAVAGVRRLNFPGPNKSVTAEGRKVEIEIAASLWRHCSTATLRLLRGVVKKNVKLLILSFLLKINWYIFRLYLVYSL